MSFRTNIYLVMTFAIVLTHCVQSKPPKVEYTDDDDQTKSSDTQGAQDSGARPPANWGQRSPGDQPPYVNNPGYYRPSPSPSVTPLVPPPQPTTNQSGCTALNGVDTGNPKNGEYVQIVTTDNQYDPAVKAAILACGGRSVSDITVTSVTPNEKGFWARLDLNRFSSTYGFTFCTNLRKYRSANIKDCSVIHER